MFKSILDKIIVFFVGATIGPIIGFLIATVTSILIATIVSFADITMRSGIYSGATYFEELSLNMLAPAIIWGSFGAIVGLTTGIGITFMGIRPHASLIWPLITGAGILLGGWIGKDRWLIADIVQGNWSILIFITINSVMAAWIVVRLIERMLSKRLFKGRITPWVICGYIGAFALFTVVTSELLHSVTVMFAY